MICRAAALVYLAVTNTVTLLRLPPMSEREKDVEILARTTTYRSCTGNTRRITRHATTYTPLPTPVNPRPR